MTNKFKAHIEGVANSKHPDVKAGEVVKFTDVYTVRSDRFESYSDMYKYINHDMLLVIGGGYDTDTVGRYTFKLETL